MKYIMFNFIVLPIISIGTIWFLSILWISYIEKRKTAKKMGGGYPPSGPAITITLFILLLTFLVLVFFWKILC